MTVFMTTSEAVEKIKLDMKTMLKEDFMNKWNEWPKTVMLAMSELPNQSFDVRFDNVDENGDYL